jgi:hypothetical protein
MRAFELQKLELGGDTDRRFTVQPELKRVKAVECSHLEVNEMEISEWLNEP